MELSEIVVKEVLKYLGTKLREFNWDSKEIEPDLVERIDKHLRYVSNWSSHTEFFGRKNNYDIEDVSIELNFSTLPRRLRPRGAKKNSFIKERDLIDTGSSFLILGDPGSGKTTTLKRIAQSLFFEPCEKEQILFQYPLLIRLRELKGSESIIEHIASIIGLKFERKVIERLRDNEEYGREKDYEHKKMGGRIKYIEQKYIIDREEKLMSGDRQLIDVLIDFLDNTKAIILIDGLDEAQAEFHGRIKSELSKLSLHLSYSRILLTSRNEINTSSLEGFDEVEICPLDEDDIKKIAKYSIDNPDEFCVSLFGKKIYTELAQRPLFLAFLLFYFRESGELPDKPKNVYEDIVDLALIRWDKERNIRKRKSKYAQFNASQKREFLSELSFRLTYKLKQKTLYTEYLIDSYKEMHRKYGLPASEAELVAKEIESHTGLLVESSNATYEFSHLIIQEFLCAEYLLEELYSETIVEYLKSYPAPLAVAIAISKNPSRWFSILVLGTDERMKYVTAESMEPLLARLLIEKPYFEPTVELGFAILYLALSVFKSKPQSMHKILRYENVMRSMLSALKYYVFLKKPDGSSDAKVQLNIGYCGDIKLKIPNSGVFGHDFIAYFLSNSDATIRETTHNKMQAWIVN